MALYGWDGDTVVDGNGTPVEGAAVYIYEQDDITPVTLYSGSGGGSKSNPLTTDANGVYEFYAAPGFYNHKSSHGSFYEHWERNRQIVTVTTSNDSFREVTVDAVVDPATDYILDCDATAAAFSVTMPLLTAVAQGRPFGIRKSDSTANIITVKDSGGSTILTVEIENEGVWIAHNGTTWKKVGVM